MRGLLAARKKAVLWYNGGSKLTGKTADIGRGPVSGVFPRKGIFLWKL